MSVESDDEPRSNGHCTKGDHRNPCPTSFGILQIKWYYNPDSNPTNNSYPMSKNITAFSLDYTAAMLRGCYEGWQYFGSKARGDLLGCMGGWYSGSWHDGAANSYIAAGAAPVRRQGVAELVRLTRSVNWRRAAAASSIGACRASTSATSPTSSRSGPRRRRPRSTWAPASGARPACRTQLPRSRPTTAASSSTPACGSRRKHAQAQLRRGHDRADALHRAHAEPHRPHRRRRHASAKPARSSSRRQNIAACQADDERIHGLRIRRSLPFFADVMGQPGFARGDDAEIPPLAKPAHADITFDDRYDARRAAAGAIELLSVPGGETIDSLVVWLPDDGVALVGNMFSALFGHFPNLVTMRGDRMRSAPAFVDSVQRVIDLEPEVLLLGHHGPVRGADDRPRRVRTHPRRGAVRARRDRRRDEPRRSTCGPRCTRSRCPSSSSSGEAYGRVDWSVRAIWETLRGLVPPALDARALRRRRPSRARRRSSRSRAAPTRSRRRADALAATDPLTAVRLCELALATDAGPPSARSTAYRARARTVCSPSTAGANFWLTRWLEGEIRSATNRLARLDADVTARPIRIDDLREPRLDDGAARRARLRRARSTSRSTTTRCSTQARDRARLRRLRRSRLPRPARRDARRGRGRHRARTDRPARGPPAHACDC